MKLMKALLIVVLSLMALGIFAVALVSLAATAGLATAAVAISESGIVQAFEEVADGAEQVQIDVADNRITFSNPDSGESRTVSAGAHFERGRVTFNLPQVTINDSGERVMVSSDGEVMLPEITITDPDNGQSRVIRPSTERFEATPGAARIVCGEPCETAEFGLQLVGGFLRGLFTLTVLAIIAAGALLYWHSRRRPEQTLAVKDMADKSS